MIAIKIVFVWLYLKEFLLLVPDVLLVGRRLHVQVVPRPRQDLPPGHHLAAVGRPATEKKKTSINRPVSFVFEIMIWPVDEARTARTCSKMTGS